MTLPGHIGLGFVLVIVLAVVPARADVRILSSSGGAVSDYFALFARVRQSGERVIIDGPCLSACTLVLSTIPRNRICVTRLAVLGFHAPQWIDQSGHAWRTREPRASSPPHIRQGCACEDGDDTGGATGSAANGLRSVGLVPLAEQVEALAEKMPRSQLASRLQIGDAAQDDRD